MSKLGTEEPPAGANYRISSYIFLYGLQMRVLLEHGYYSRAWIILKDCQLKESKTCIFSLIPMFLMTPGTINGYKLHGFNDDWFFCTNLKMKTHYLLILSKSKSNKFITTL